MWHSANLLLLVLGLSRSQARSQGPARKDYLPPSVGQGDAAPSQKSAEEKVMQVKTGPSQCLAETGWRGTCEKDREGGSFSCCRADRVGIFWGRSSEQAVLRWPVCGIQLSFFTEKQTCADSSDNRDLASSHTDPKDSLKAQKTSCLKGSTKMVLA